MTSHLQDLKDVLITKEVENSNFNVNFHSNMNGMEYQRRTIPAPRTIMTLSGVQPERMQATITSKENGVTVPLLQTHLNAQIKVCLN